MPDSAVTNVAADFILFACDISARLVDLSAPPSVDASIGSREF
jgi:hypothetical protein